MLDFLKGKKILITGNTGFKGSWLVAILSQYTNEIYGLSKDIPTNPSHYKILKQKVINNGYIDIKNLKNVSNLINKIKPDFIFHLAAQSLVFKSYIQTVDTYETNIIGTLNILESLRYLKTKCVAIIITSDKAYQNNEWPFGYRENDILGGNDPYSSSKAATEMVISGYLKSFFLEQNKIRIGIARAGNVIGGGDWSKDRIIPDCIKNWSKGKQLNIRNPYSIRPWQHVLEPLFGYIFFARELFFRKKLNGEVFNFGPASDMSKSVLDLVSELSKYWPKSKWKIENINNNKVKESNFLTLNCDKAYKYLNWSPTLTFNKTIQYTSKWYQSFYNNKKQINNITNYQIDEFLDSYLNKYND